MITCPSCGEENPERAKFCLNCATPLGAENEARPELKFATALFADLVGSTTLAEQEDPEVVQSVVGRSFDRLRVEIERYGGLLDRIAPYVALERRTTREELRAFAEALRGRA